MSHYLKLYAGIRTKAHSDQLAIAILQEVVKDERVEAMKAERAERLHDSATGKQRGKLRALGLHDVANNEDLTKVEASKLIEANI